MKEIIETLYPMDAYLLGSGYDNRLEYLKHLIDIETIHIKSGTKVGTWTVPEEWIIRDAWVKLNGVKIIDFKKDPLSVVIGSESVNKKVTLDELRNHWNFSDEKPDAVPYKFNYYSTKAPGENWGFCVRKNEVKQKIEYDKDGKLICENGVCMPELKDFDSSVGKVQIEGMDYKPKFADKLPADGEYEVFIDSEFKPGIMKIGVHTIPGKSKREVLLFAHLDHPYQANDNLSGVACLVDMARKIHADHTIKLIFCPETIGSIAYAETQDISKVDFVIAVDICGNKNSLLLQKSWNMEDRVNRVAHLAIQGMGESFRKGQFRNTIGSDEYAFNDPLIDIPGLMISTHDYPEYHTSEDTPDKISYNKIEEVQTAVMKIIEVYEKDFIPVRKFTSPLMRSKYNIQTESPQMNLAYDYFFYAMDGKRTLAELCCEYGLNFEFTLEIINKMIDEKDIERIGFSKGDKQKTSRKESSSVQRKSNVSRKSNKAN